MQIAFLNAAIFGLYLICKTGYAHKILGDNIFVNVDTFLPQAVKNFNNGESLSEYIHKSKVWFS